MKKAILILLSIICLSVTSQAQSVKKTRGQAPVIDTTHYYVFTEPRAQLLYQMLEAYKGLVSTSEEITARVATKVYLPKIDTLERTLSEQANAYKAASEKAKAKADSISKIKTK